MSHTDRLAAAAANLQAAETGLDREILQARADGVTWAVITEATGLSLSSIRWRAKRAAPPDEQWKWVQDRRERAAGAEPVPREPLPAGALTIVEAARRLGVTRATVYAWRDAGRIPGAVTIGGRGVILAEEDGSVRVVPA